MVTMSRPDVIRPGLFGGVISADTRRNVFDYHNEVLISHQTKIDFLFIGDSITDMWDVETYFGGKGNRIVNRGIGGDMTPYLLRRFPADCVQLKPRYAIILIGVNNTWALDAWRACDIPKPEKLQKEIVADILKMVNLAKDDGIIPIVCSILPTCIDTNKQTEQRNDLIIAINQQLKKEAENLSIPFVNYHSYLVAEDGKTLQPGLAEDGLHPHVLGYNIMADALCKELRKYNITI
ncbi:GDSL-type esterase/lipase family protein [Niallia sp. JL1B1071]|uniref:GDSL-type esterase/lipase family protein n=1 Tax=Niallia tiangongensis TaxID=3237105 RepID=UPI0037DC480F